MKDAADIIRASLVEDARARGQRILAAFGLMVALVGAFVLAFGHAPMTGGRQMMALVAGALVLGGLGFMASPRARLLPGTATLLALFACGVPLLSATPTEAPPGLGCLAILAALGVTLVVVVGRVLGPARRRFNGASQMLALVTASAAAAAVGLACPHDAWAHLAAHSAGMLVVTGVVLAARNER